MYIFIFIIYVYFWIVYILFIIPGMQERGRLRRNCGECSKRFRVMFKKLLGKFRNISENVQKDSGEYRKDSRKYSKNFRGIFKKFKGNIWNFETWNLTLKSYLETLSKSLALYAFSYDSLIIVGDFNISVEEFCMSGFYCSTSSSNLYS